MSEQQKPSRTQPQAAAAQARVPPERRGPAIPPREPEGLGAWRVTVHHTPLLEAKSVVVQATSREEAWQRFLDAAAQDVNTNLAYRRNPGHAGVAQAWLADARKNGPPPGTEILGAEYVAARVDALRVKGTVSKEQIGFEELASI